MSVLLWAEDVRDDSSRHSPCHEHSRRAVPQGVKRARHTDAVRLALVGLERVVTIERSALLGREDEVHRVGPVLADGQLLRGLGEQPVGMDRYLAKQSLM